MNAWNIFGDLQLFLGWRADFAVSGLRTRDVFLNLEAMRNRLLVDWIEEDYACPLDAVIVAILALEEYLLILVCWAGLT